MTVVVLRGTHSHIIRVEISSTRNEVRIPPLSVEPLAGKSGSKGVAAAGT